jgi:hypothetical protein
MKTNFSTKQGVVNYLKEIESREEVLANKNLHDTVAYAITKWSKTTLADLKDVAVKAQAFLESIALAKKVQLAENSVKAKPTPRGKTAPKTNTGRPQPKTSTTNKVEFENSSTKSPNQPVVVASFPAQIVNEEFGTLSINFEIQSLEDLNKAIEDGQEIVACGLWTKRHLKQFTYDDFNILGGSQPDSFPDNIDIIQFLYVSAEGKVAIGMSATYEVPYVFTPDTFEVIDNMRYSNAMEFNLYTVTPAEEE